LSAKKDVCWGADRVECASARFTWPTASVLNLSTNKSPGRSLNGFLNCLLLLIVVVIDARTCNAIFTTHAVIELGHPTLIALNMVDVAESNGHHMIQPNSPKRLGAVSPIIASKGTEFQSCSEAYQVS